MKIKSSTQWCNLYLTESKYNIAIGNAKADRYFKWCCYFLLVIVFFSILAPITQKDHIDSFLIFLVLITTSAFIVLLKSSKKTDEIKELVLYSNGLIDFEDDINLSLHPNSRIGWFGCWLILIKDENSLLNNKNQQLIKVYISKNSVSDADYSRLSRHILKN